jgi:hypothetical protein
MVFESGRQPHLATIAERKKWLEFVRTVPSLADLRQEYHRAFRSGLIVGSMLSGVLSGKGKLGQMRNDLAKRHAISPSLIQTDIWPNYKAVAPYWAAYMRLDTRGPLPCQPQELWKFLDLSENLRLAGEQFRGRHAPRPLLKIGETIQIPKELTLVLRRPPKLDA